MPTLAAGSPRSLASSRLAVALAAALALVAASAAAEKGGGKGKPPKGGAEAPAQGQGKPAETSAPAPAAEARHGTDRGFGDDESRVIREWFAHPRNLEGLPPGLAKRESLPPGLQKQLEKNGKLPPGLQAKLQPLPDDLARRLPPPPEGTRRTVLGSDVLLLEQGTDVVRDILRNVLPALTQGR